MSTAYCGNEAACVCALYSKGVDKGGARGAQAPPVFEVHNIAVRCSLRGEYPIICIYALNNIPAPPLLQTCLRPCTGSEFQCGCNNSICGVSATCKALSMIVERKNLSGTLY